MVTPTSYLRVTLQMQLEYLQPPWFLSSKLGMAVLAECLSAHLRDFVRVVRLGNSGKGR